MVKGGSRVPYPALPLELHRVWVAWGWGYSDIEGGLVLNKLAPTWAHLVSPCKKRTMRGISPSWRGRVPVRSSTEEQLKYVLLVSVACPHVSTLRLREKF